MTQSEQQQRKEDIKQKQESKIMLDRTPKGTNNTRDDDTNNCEQEMSALQEIQTVATDGATQPAGSVKNGLHAAGNVSDEAESETRPAKRARRVQPATASISAAAAATDDTANSSNVDPATTTVTQKSRRTSQQNVNETHSSSAAAAAAPPASEARQLRSRTVPAQPAVANKPPKEHSGTTMKLRKRPAVNNSSRDVRVAAAQAGPSSNNTYNEHRRSIDVGECEVCLHPYALSYLSKHRNKVHGLAHTTYGCPYCLTTFSSHESRLAHIEKEHRGKPAHWSAKEGGTALENVKVHMYACPLCPAHFTHSGLACHLGSSHHTSIDAFAGEIYCKCPFCMASSNDNGKQLSRFQSEDELRGHIAKKHTGCFLLDDIKAPADRVFTRPGEKCKPAPKKAPPPLPQESSDDDDEEEVWEDLDEEDSDAGHWKKLDHNGLIKDYLYGDYVSVDFGMGALSTAIKAVDEQLKTMQNTKGANDDDYAAEMKLYNKGLKDRKQKADAERIEKERHREEVERKLMQIQYENRNKKKRSAHDIEYDEFLKRPISFALATRESARKTTSCRNGDECELCVSHVQEPETDSSGQLIDAPSCRTNVVGDNLKAAQSPEADDAKRGTGRPRRGRRVGPTTRSLLMLQEMKHSLRFVAEYNAGYFRHK